MKVIIAGSRSITDKESTFELLDKAKEYFGSISVVISGCANGVDKIGEEWAELNNIEVQRFPADWDKYGKKAGFIRNSEMAKAADGLIAIYDGISKGTKNMIDTMKKLGKEWYVCTVLK